MLGRRPGTPTPGGILRGGTGTVNFGGDRNPEPRRDDTSHVPPAIKKVMLPYWNKFGTTVRFRQILEEAGLKWEDVPKLPGHEIGGRSSLCCTHMAGRCPMGSRCRMAASHGAKPSSAWAANFAKIIKPGVDKVVALGKVEVAGNGWGDRKRKAGDN